MIEPLLLPARKIKSIIGSPEKSAAAVHLRYINDFTTGLHRIKKGKHFVYVDSENKVIRNKGVLSRIASLVIPPAWKDVWICPFENGHLQATGLDAKNRKQYLYHPQWHSLRNQTKFYRLIQFGYAIPAIRAQVKADLSKPGMPVEKVLAIVLSLMEQTGIRVGNSFYEKLYGSFGLTTLKNKHVHIDGSEVQFSFTGKKGVYQNVTLKNKRLAKMVKACMDIPGRELFQYYTLEGTKKSVDSGLVNEYIKNITGEEFTAKDFRTWSGTVQAFRTMKEMTEADQDRDRKKNVVTILDTVSQVLGNTRTVCKKYYVHPSLLSKYEAGDLDKYLSVSKDDQASESAVELSADEKLVLKILESA